MTVLSDERLDQIAAGGDVLTPPATAGRKHYRPLADAASEYVHSARTRDQRINTGLPEFDAAMRGLGPKELLIVQGFAHAGKTLFTTQMIVHNKDKRMVLFTPDESRVLVLVKLASLISGISAEHLEEMIAGDNPAGEQIVRDAAAQFPFLAVFDDVADYQSMHRACDEAAAAHGGEAELVIFDYADLFGGVTAEDGGTPQRINTLKAWGKDRAVPLALLHQASRSQGRGGQAMSIDSGAYGGEQQATFVVGVRRKKEQYVSVLRDLEAKMATAKTNQRYEIEEQIAEARHMWWKHSDTITFNLVKNKRPPSRLVDEIDYRLDPQTGRLEQLEPLVVPAPVAAQPAQPAWEQPVMFEGAA